ncbi:hypothetical protein BOX37_07725 [Nocardia mangyaensis]|uniref:Uncharacterized protein n=1 Tax=Nocardia mangyaensis TaxID=2213200 RepID=A0A1J0W1A8_9NOCA|nr:hypothetical protein [Nocardia mangyaensis]APE38112.1 hypothetical protein BOX37_07725 [Nocardia mangyaensis]
MSDDLNMAEKFKRGCISILVGVVAVYCAVGVIESIWPTLALILGIAGVIGVIAGLVLLYRKIRSGW